MIDDWSQEPSTEEIAAQLDELRVQLAEMQERAAVRDEVITSSLAQLHQPTEYADPAPSEIVARTPRALPPLPQVAQPITEAVTRQALAAAAATVPEWSNVSSDVVERIQSDPQRFGDLVRSGDSLSVSSYLAGVARSAQASRDTRQMKLNAMSATGASGRSKAPPENEWDNVMTFAKSQRNYWD